jgi:glutamyl-tRNA synthetase
VAIAARIGHPTAAETFNPVMVDFYRTVGYLPEAILNYLMLLGWSLDDKTEDLTREEMIRHFSLARVTKSPASFDPKKLWAFEDRYMQRLPLKQKVAAMLPFLQRAGLVPDPPPCEVGPKLTRIVQACGDRLKTHGDILTYADFFFLADDQLSYDEQELGKRLATPEARQRLAAFRDVLAGTEPFTAAALEEALRQFVAAQQLKTSDLVHPLRLAVTGKTVGPGLYDCLEILGRQACLQRIDRALAIVAGRDAS